MPGRSANPGTQHFTILDCNRVRWVLMHAPDIDLLVRSVLHPAVRNVSIQPQIACTGTRGLCGQARNNRPCHTDVLVELSVSTVHFLSQWHQIEFEYVGLLNHPRF